MEVDVKITGLKEIMESMATIVKPQEQIKIVKGCVGKGAEVVSKNAAQRLGKGKGYIGIGVRRIRNKSNGKVAVFGIGIKKKHWPEIFREFGTIERYTKKGARRGQIKMNAFLKPAMESQKENVLRKVLDWMEYVFKTIFEAKQRHIQEPPIEIM